MEVVERFVLNDLPNGEWSVCWPGYEFVVVNNSRKAKVLLNILFNDIGVNEAMLAVKQDNKENSEEVMHISDGAWYQHPDATAEHLVERHVVVGCKFVNLEQAEKFKLHMEQRLAWKRLGGTWK